MDINYGCLTIQIGSIYRPQGDIYGAVWITLHAKGNMEETIHIGYGYLIQLDRFGPYPANINLILNY